MQKPKIKRVTRKLSKAELKRLKQHREQVADELPELIERDRMRREARDEGTLSGELRRAVHGSPLSLSAIALRVGISVAALDDFLTGERTLRSDTLDRLADAVGFAWPSSRHTKV
jgi:transcriptional regulator with XRE-family HTH domain